MKLDLNEWLKADDLKEKETLITFKDEGKTVPKEESGFENDTFDILIELPDGKTRRWSMNKTSQRTVAKIWDTDETKQWIGKQVKVHVLDQQVKKEMRKVIYAVSP